MRISRGLLGLAANGALAFPALAQPTSGTTYTIQSVHSPTLCVASASNAQGAAVTQATCDNGAEQQWTVNAFQTGYQLINQQSGECLDVAGYSSNQGASIDQWGCKSATSGPENQIWNFVAAYGNGYQLKVKLSGQCLDVPGASAQVGLKLDQWPCKTPMDSGTANQSWLFTPVGSNGGGGTSGGGTSGGGSSGGGTSGGGSSGGGSSASFGSGSLPAGWPKMFTIGLEVTADSTHENWVTSSGISFGQCYQYISSGTAPGSTWVTAWGTNFALNYANWAHGAHCMPTFIYYQMEPTTGSDGASVEYNTMKSTSSMANYYTDFTALMKQSASANTPVLVIVEPDLWGYLQGLNQGAPSQMAAAVASTGNADLAGIPNTVAGYGQALITLRNKYAPNVILAVHVSTWDWNLSANANVTASADNDAAWFNGTSGNLSWDLVSFDITDRDAAFYQYVRGDGGAHWWTSTNFTEMLNWARELNAKMGKRLIIWQLPFGNQVMDTCNNTAYHYQDNRFQTMIANYPSNTFISQMAAAGIIGTLWGSGGETATQNYDAAGDGVTNPAPIDGNTQISSRADDDGGYFFAQVKAYSAAPYGIQ